MSINSGPWDYWPPFLSNGPLLKQEWAIFKYYVNGEILGSIFFFHLKSNENPPLKIPRLNTA